MLFNEGNLSGIMHTINNLPDDIKNELVSNLHYLSVQKLMNLNQYHITAEEETNKLVKKEK